MATKDKSAIISGMGLGMSIVQSLVEKARKKGVSDETIHSLATPEGDAILDQFAEIMARANAATFIHDKAKDGWTLLENVGRRITSVRDLELVPFLKGGEDYINGEEMARRARMELDANLGQSDAEYMLEHQDEIPAEFRKYYLVFPGTVWRDADGDRYVPYLRWSGGRWVLRFFWFDGGWHSSVRLVRPRKAS